MAVSTRDRPSPGSTARVNNAPDDRSVVYGRGLASSGLTVIANFR